MNIIAYDFGTGGMKASLYDKSLNTLAKEFVEYETFYNGSKKHEQKPSDWWNAFVISSKQLIDASGIEPADVGAIALSGHSLVAIPIDEDGNELLNQVPIWSDSRADKECKKFFKKIDYDSWYMTTGNGFPPACYSLFKIMWLKENQPEIYNKTKKVLGSKDYINMRLTGNILTDHSYASGTGAYNLRKRCYETEFISAAGLGENLFPDIVESHHIVGKINKEVADLLGLVEGIPVACGGVDNACMALGAVGPEEGKIYTSLGSSSWVPVNSREPILDKKRHPYVFAHIEENMYTSAFSIFAGGSSFRWAKEVLCKDWITEKNVYDYMSEAAKTSSIGAGGVFFNPSLAGGSSQDKSVNIRGGFVGLCLATSREDMIRAVMEGIAMNLSNSIRFLKEKTKVDDEILFCGGGSKSTFWMQMFADVFDMKIKKTNIDQDAASIGAAAIGARAVGLWKDYSGISMLHRIEGISTPIYENTVKYKKMAVKFNHISDVLADLGDYMTED